MTDNAMTLSVAKKANASSTGDNRACSNGGSQKDKYSSSARVETRDGGFQKRPLYNGDG